MEPGVRRSEGGGVSGWFGGRFRGGWVVRGFWSLGVGRGKGLELGGVWVCCVLWTGEAAPAGCGWEVAGRVALTVMRRRFPDEAPVVKMRG